MKILFLCHRLPYPPDRGGKIRPFNAIKHLGRIHEVTVASLSHSKGETEDGAGLEAYCQKQIIEQTHQPIRLTRMLGRLPTRFPSTMGYFSSPGLARRINEELASIRYDLILVHCAYMAPYVAGRGYMPKILDFGDLDSQKYFDYGHAMPFPTSVAYRFEAVKLRLAEKKLAESFDVCTCTTRSELKVLERLGTAKRTARFSNGVDAEYFQPTDEPYDPNTICFLGRMDYYPNTQCMLEFCATILPLLRARRSTTKLVIVGAAPSRRVRQLSDIPGVTVTGSVPDVRPYVRKAALSIAPLNIARGTQNKILESLAMGVPAVCSEQAAKGVDAAAGEHLQTARTPEQYVDAILRLLNDPRERQRFAMAGRERMLSHHHWGNSMKRLDEIIDDCLRMASS